MTGKTHKRIGDGKKAILSFDDGPAPVDALQSILKTLKDQKLKAEFYVIGNEVEQYPDATKMIVRDGHSLQNHSWSHLDLGKAPESTVRNELGKTQKVISSATGTTPTKVRPPYGAGGFRPQDPELIRVAGELSLKIVTWDIDTNDWARPKGLGPNKLADVKSQLVGQDTKKLFNILMHVQAETARDLPSFIGQLRTWGLVFATP